MKQILFIILFTILITKPPNIYKYNQCETYLYTDSFNELSFYNYDKYEVNKLLYIWRDENRIKFVDKGSTNYKMVQFVDLRFSTKIYINDSLYYYLSQNTLIEFKITSNYYSKKVYTFKKS